ncbi:MAG: hypothetical protein ABSF46_27365 [Terriglobia bacterium]
MKNGGIALMLCLAVVGVVGCNNGEAGMPSAEPALRKIFPVGPYKLDMSIANLQGLVELSPSEYAALSRGIVFAGEKDFHARTTKFLGYDWDIAIGVVGQRIYKISPLLEFGDVASEDKAYSAIYNYCRQQLVLLC